MDQQKLIRGVLPGIIAGYTFLAFAGPGMNDMVGGMIGADAFIGFILHVIFSAVIGAIYTAVFVPYTGLLNDHPLKRIVIGGLIYGLIWWIVGGNIIMPVIAGGDALQLAFGPSFYGHIIFGHVLAFVVVLRDRAFGLSDDDGK